MKNKIMKTMLTGVAVVAISVTGLVTAAQPAQATELDQVVEVTEVTETQVEQITDAPVETEAPEVAETVQEEVVEAPVVEQPEVEAARAEVPVAGATQGAPLAEGIAVAGAPVAASATRIAQAKYDVLSATNKHRQNARLQPVFANAELDKIAQDWANYLVRTGNLYHNGALPSQMNETGGIYVMKGENLAEGHRNGTEAVTGWMNSDGHRKQIMNSLHNRMGAGVAYRNGTRPVYVQVFGELQGGTDTLMTYPKPGTDASSPFVDMDRNSNFFKEIKWMFDNKLTTGTKTPEGVKYMPKNGMSREAMAAFMYRMSGDTGYKPNGRKPFADIPTNHKFYKEISWMKDNGMTTVSIRTSEHRQYSG
ncbi:CAP domain-containing protein [Leucobacter sp. HY1910]